jgi:hypothetical protein
MYPHTPTPSGNAGNPDKAAFSLAICIGGFTVEAQQERIISSNPRAKSLPNKELSVLFLECLGESSSFPEQIAYKSAAHPGVQPWHQTSIDHRLVAML